MTTLLELALAVEQQVKQAPAAKQRQGETGEVIDNKTNSQAAVQTIVKIQPEQTDPIVRAGKETTQTKMQDGVAKTMEILKIMKKASTQAQFQMDEVVLSGLQTEADNKRTTSNNSLFYQQQIERVLRSQQLSSPANTILLAQQISN